MNAVSAPAAMAPPSGLRRVQVAAATAFVAASLLLGGCSTQPGVAMRVTASAGRVVEGRESLSITVTNRSPQAVEDASTTIWRHTGDVVGLVNYAVFTDANGVTSDCEVTTGGVVHTGPLQPGASRTCAVTYRTDGATVDSGLDGLTARVRDAKGALHSRGIDEAKGSSDGWVEQAV